MSLTQSDIAERWAALDDTETQGEVRTARKFVRPLSEVSDSLIDALRVEDGIGLGLTQIDVLTRGFRPTDLVIITGFAHSGKTQLVNTMICNNPDKRILFFSLDDPAEMILAKLVAMKNGVSAETIEKRVRSGEDKAKEIVRYTAETVFPNLFVVDDVIGIPQMLEAIGEAEEIWGGFPDAVVIDYVEMMPGGGISEDQGATVKQKMNDLKTWAKQAPYPLIALHQGTRSNARPGEPITLLSMGFSGEQQATIVLGCRRRRDQNDMESWERQHHLDTMTVHLVKNKRPGGKMTPHEGIDFHLDPVTGLIEPEKDPGHLTPAASMAQVSMEISGA